LSTRSRLSFSEYLSDNGFFIVLPLYITLDACKR
jgi:hypothetical protein